MEQKWIQTLTNSVAFQVWDSCQLRNILKNKHEISDIF